jgi:hypothetical protein
LFRAGDALSAEEIDRYIDAGVAAFLAAYGAPPSATRER